MTNREKEFEDIPEKYPRKIIVDLVRQFTELDYEGKYEGISWGNININPAQDSETEHTMVRLDF